MEAKELRIGNIVHGHKDNFNISHETLCDFANGYFNLLPVKLTEDWLIDFGFYQVELDNGEKYYQNYRFRLNCNYNGFYYSRNLDVNYVHQLQNLYFALTGEELEIQK